MNIPVKYLIQLGYDESGAIAYQRDLKRCEDATNKFGVQSGRAVEILDRKQNIFFNKQGKQVINTSYLWKDNFGKTFKTTLQEVGDDMNVVGVQVGSLGQKMKKSAGLSKEFTNALKRVTIVVPVWMIARNILQGVLQTLSSGMTYWKDFSNAITKAKQTFTDIKDVNMEAYIAGLTDRIRDLSIETGKTMAELVNTMYRFTTVGLSVQRAEEGMAEAVRLANLMFGNQDEIGRVIAQVYRLLGDNMADTIPEQKRMQVIGSQIYKLWKDNAFEIGELTQAYQKFLPTANVFNFSVTQSTALLATLETAALKSGRAGRLLRTSINKLAENSTQLAKEFGIVVTGGESTFDVLMKILGAVNKMDTAKFPIEKFRKFNLFGGVRSREAAMALSAAYELLKKNIDAINPSMDNLNKLLEEEKSAHDDVKESLGFQLKKLTNLRAQLGEAFIKGVVGAKSFKEAIVAYNSALENSQKLVSHIGDSLTTMLEVAYGLPIAFDMFFTMAKQNVEDFQTIYGNIGKAMKGSLPISEVERLISTIKSGAIDVSKLEILPGKSVEEKKTKILQA
ncbi:MAG: phage tail tape measure protein, partial [Candidatus Aenigmatarchaeota archaeon]